MNSYDFFINEFICFMNSYMNSDVPRFQMRAWRNLVIHGGLIQLPALARQGNCCSQFATIYFRVANLSGYLKSWSKRQPVTVSWRELKWQWQLD